MTAHILRRVAGVGVVAAVMVSAVLAGLTGTPAALAQDGDPQITVEAVHPLPDAFHFIVDMTDASGEPLSDKVVTATPTSPSGDAGSPVTLDPAGDGVYQGPLDFPEDGTWTVRIASTDPAASIDYQYAVGGGPQPTTTTTAAPAADEAGATGAVPATTTTTALTGNDISEQAAATNENDDSDSLPVVLLIVGVAFLVAMAGVPLALRTIRDAKKRNRPGTPPEGG